MTRNQKKATKDSKKVDTNITANGSIICAVAFYGNKEFTILFVYDDSSKSIKGSIFKGKVNNKTIDSPDRIAQFAGKNGKITVVTANGSNEVAVQ